MWKEVIPHYNVKKICGLVLMASLIIGVLASCDRKPDEFRIGVIAYLSGENAQFSGEPTVNAARLAVQEQNAGGGLNVAGRKYKVILIVEDIPSKPEMAVNAARKLIYKEDVAALIGPQYSRDAIPVARLAKEAQIPMISPMSTHSETTADKSCVFRIGFMDDFQGWVMARFARTELDAKKAAVLYDVASEYNKDIATVFKQAFEAAGGQVPAFETYTTDSADDFGSQLERIKKSGAEVLFLPNYIKDVTLQVRQARRLALTATIIGSDSWDSNLVADLPEFEGTFFSRHWHPDIINERSRAYIERYTHAYGQAPKDAAALTYDALSLLFIAIQSQGKIDTASICDGLYQAGPYKGVTGVIKYRGSGNPLKSAVIVQIKDGKESFYTLVDPK